MRVCFWRSDKPRERLLADAFADGVKQYGAGDTVEQRPLLETPELADCDVAVMVGVKSRELYRAHWDAGIHVVMIDKGYSRHAAQSPVKLWEYWRVAVDAHHPTAYLMNVPRAPDRLERLGLEPKPWKDPERGAILLAGSSAKYHEFYGMKDPTRWATKVVAEIRKHTDREIIYRPKPSWRDAVPIPGTEYSTGKESIDAVLERCGILLTHGSNAGFEATLAGLRCIVLGEGIAKPIAAQTLDAASGRGFPPIDDGIRTQWLANLAYCQWTMAEFASGRAWRYIRNQTYG